VKQYKKQRGKALGILTAIVAIIVYTIVDIAIPVLAELLQIPRPLLVALKTTLFSMGTAV